MIIGLILIFLLFIYLISHYFKIDLSEKTFEFFEIIWFYGLRIFFLIVSLYGIYDFVYLENYLQGLIEFSAGIFCFYLSIKHLVWKQFFMTGVKIELLIEFGVILLAPIIHTFYLWKYKKVDKQILHQNIKIFAGLYLVFGLIGFFLFFA